MNAFHRLTLSVVLLAVATACGGVTSENDAKRAYLGLDTSIETSILLGFLGYSAATGANITPQSTSGEKTGFITVSGQVDQGSSNNKGMRLFVLLEDYSDGAVDDAGNEIAITYNTDPEAQPALNLSLRDLPDGTLAGTLVGDYLMEGELVGSVHLDLAFSSDLETDDFGTVFRVPGSTRITGTATADNGAVFNVDLSL